MNLLICVIEKWEANVRKYDRRNSERGVRHKLSSDLNMTSFESLLLPVLEFQLVLNKLRLNAWEAQKEGVVEGMHAGQSGQSNRSGAPRYSDQTISASLKWQ